MVPGTHHDSQHVPDGERGKCLGHQNVSLVLCVSKPSMKGLTTAIFRWTMTPWVMEAHMAKMTFSLVIPNDSAFRVSGWLFEALEVEFKRG